MNVQLNFKKIYPKIQTFLSPLGNDEKNFMSINWDQATSVAPNIFWCSMIIMIIMQSSITISGNEPFTIYDDL